jgi:hypothetical protein
VVGIFFLERLGAYGVVFGPLLRGLVAVPDDLSITTFCLVIFFAI